MCCDGCCAYCSDAYLDAFNVPKDDFWVWGAVIYLVFAYIVVALLTVWVLSRVRVSVRARVRA